VATGGVMTAGWQTDAHPRNLNVSYHELKLVIGYKIDDSNTDH